MSPVIFIIGAGKNIGLTTAARFANEGYKVAIASRSAVTGKTSEGYLSIPLDLSDSTTVRGAFDKVVADLGPPSVVVYNASGHAPGPDGPFSIDLTDFSHSLQTNTVSVYAAIQAAHSHLPALKSKDEKLTFLYTGNILNKKVMPALLSGGAGKTATAHVIDALAAANKDSSFRIYYVDQRQPDGGPSFKVGAEAHANFFLQLTEQDTQGPSQATFVDGEGYREF